MLKTKLSKIKLNDFKSVEEYTDEVTRLANELRSTGATVEDEEEFVWLLNGLPKSYNYVRAAAMANLHLNADVEGVGDLIIDQCGSVSASGDERSKGSPFAVASASKICFNCGKEGHIQRFCKRGNNGNRGNNSRNFSNGNYNSGKNNYKRNDNSNTSKVNNEIKCYRCNGIGHIGKNCEKYGDYINSSEV